MKFTSKIFVAVFVLMFVFVGVAGVVNAQTIGTMPFLYNSSGAVVNNSGGFLTTGTYYLNPNGTEPVSYTDGVYYDPATNLFGGSVYNPTGQAGTFTIPAAGSVGIPNTGVGGNAAVVWALLLVGAIASVAGAAYLARTRYVRA